MSRNQPATCHRTGAPTLIVLGMGAGAWLVLKDGAKAAVSRAASPKPAPRHTVVVHQVIHQTVTRVVGSGSHLNGVEMTIIAVIALGILCAIFLSRSSS